jgi:Zn ribbon nucleic-acid-binding protein
METMSTFLGLWDQYMFIGSVVCIITGILILLYHEYRVLKIKDLKEKYDYVNQHEIQYFWYAVIAFIAAAAVYANTIMTSKILNDGMRWFYVRLFITACFGIIAYIVFFSLVRIYYPRLLERRLSRLRNTPRTSPDGNIMRKLTESEEEHHLEGELLAQGEIHTIDYDVWIDDKTGYTKIEKYPAYQHAEECSECGYYTLKIDQEEIEQAPTANEQGVLLTHYECSYCGHREQREITVAKLSANIA